MKRILPYQDIPYEELINKIRRIAGLNDLRVYKCGPFFWLHKSRSEIFFERNEFMPLLEGFIRRKNAQTVTLRLYPVVIGWNIPTILLFLCMAVVFGILAPLQPPFSIYLLLALIPVGTVVVGNFLYSLSSAGQLWMERLNDFMNELQHELENPFPGPQRKDY